MAQRKIGIYGGAFNPIHMGHLNSVETLLKQFKLSKVLIVPAYQSPLKKWEDSPSPVERYEMACLAFKDFEPKVQVLDVEIKKPGPSYTIHLIDSLVLKSKTNVHYLIIGVDQFFQFDLWKKFESILEKSHLIVTSRPGGDLPADIEGFPKGIQRLVKKWSLGVAHLTTGKKIHFVRLKDKNVSSSQVRRRYALGQRVSDLIPLSVEKYIEQHQLYRGVDAKTLTSELLAKECYESLSDGKGFQLAVYDIRGDSAVCDLTVVASATSTKQAQGLSDRLVEHIKSKFGVRPLSVEGATEGRWVAVDFGSVIVHIFYDFSRQQYRIEDLWKQARKLDMTAVDSRSSADQNARAQE